MSGAGQFGMHRLAIADGPGIVVGRSGASIGQVHMCEVDFWPHNTALYVTSFHENDRRFIYYLLQSLNLQRFNSGGAQPSLNRNFIYPLQIAVPEPVEQCIVAEALSDADGSLGALDALIAKKRAIKHAAMQQLLTGKTRLPGLSGHWQEKRFGEIASIRNQKVMPADEDPDTLCVELEHLGQGDGRLLEASTARYSRSSKYRFVAGDVLFGRLRPYLRKFWLANRAGVCTTELWPLAVDPERADSSFLLAVIQLDAFIEAASASYGTHMPRADWGVLRDFELWVPPLNEQAAIAAILSGMDAEIVALEERLDKTQAIKQGMMQQLLTGRIRLVAPPRAAERA